MIRSPSYTNHLRPTRDLFHRDSRSRCDMASAASSASAPTTASPSSSSSSSKQVGTCSGQYFNGPGSDDPAIPPCDRGAGTLRLLQNNLNKSKPPTAELNHWVYDVALVQEPSIGAGARINVLAPPRRSFCKERARAAVVIDGSRRDFWPIDSLSSRDLAAVAMMDGDSNTFVLASVYLDITTSVIIPELHRLATFCKEKKFPLVLGLDSNAHSTMWGEESTNNRGEILELWMAEMNLSIVNRGRVPTFVLLNGSRSTIIDITLVNSWALDLTTDWCVEVGESSLSDHRKITFQVRAEVPQKKILRRAFRKANWLHFNKALHNKGLHWLSDFEVDNIEGLAKGFQDSLRDVLDGIAPLKEYKLKSRDNWWTDELTLKRRILKNVYRKRSLHPRVLEKYKELRKDFSKCIKRTKRQSWQNFCTRAESAKDVARLVQILDNPPSRLMSLLHDDEVLPPDRSVQHLLETHFPDGEIMDDETVTEDDDAAPMNCSSAGVSDYIDVQKVEAAFASFGDYKSPGPDEIPPIALKYLDTQHREMLCLLYKLSVTKGIIPKVWRRMRVTFIPKAGKADYAVAKAYRPITLSNFILKGLERIIQWYILERHVTRPLPHQHAYTKGRSCDSALSHFIDDAEKAVFNGQYLLAVSLDCSGAFDSIRFEAASKGMKDKNIPSNIIRWYGHLLNSRLVSAEIQGLTKFVKPKRGSPQGGVLSPLIWNLIMDGFLSQFNKGPVKVLGYADDILIYVQGLNPNVMGEILQPIICRVLSWGQNNGLSFNPKKTSMVLFTRRRVFSSPQIKMGEILLKMDDSLRYLGGDSGAHQVCKTQKR